ncbi:ATP-binding cassette domain-containing protein [Facklamia hominis]
MLEVNNLFIRSNEKDLVKGLSFMINKGEIVALVGESGSGKTLTSQSMLGLLPDSLDVEGTINYRGQNLLEINQKAWKNIRGRQLSIIFQDPLLSLNPLFTIGKQLRESYFLHQDISREEIDEDLSRLLKEVGLDPKKDLLNLYPHELSGGMRQRVMIAMAVSQKPDLIIADEPTSALDSETAEMVLNLLAKMNRLYHISILFITHDIKLMRGFADRVLIMKEGEMIEQSDAESFYVDPQTNYAKLLLHTVPDRSLEVANSISEVVLKLEQVSKVYKTKLGSQKVLNTVNASVYKGKWNTIMGPSGSGKSTIVKCILGLEKPDTGKIIYKDQSIYDHDKDVWIYRNKFLRKQLYQDIKLIAQDPYAGFDPKLRMDHLLKITLKHRPHLNLEEYSYEEYLMDWFKRCQLSPEDYFAYPTQLSGGKLQRIAIIKALIQKPKLLICDEITSALDVVNKRQILDLLSSLQIKTGITIFMITHDADIERHLSDVSYRLNVGEMSRVR